MKRREDRRLLLGAGRYVDDLRPAGALSVIFVRSPHGHARITRLDVDAVRKAPGVVAVVTGDQVRHLGPMPVNRAIPDMKVPAASDHCRRRGAHGGRAGGGHRRRERQHGVGRGRAAGGRIRRAVGGGPRHRPHWPRTRPCCSAKWRAIARSACAERRRPRRGVRPRRAPRAAAHSPRSASPRWPWSPARSWPPSTSPRRSSRCGCRARRRSGPGRARALLASRGAGARDRARRGRRLRCQDRAVPRVGAPAGWRCAWAAGRWVATRGEDFQTMNHARGTVCEVELAPRADGRMLGLRVRVFSPGRLADARAAGPPRARMMPGAT